MADALSASFHHYECGCDQVGGLIQLKCIRNLHADAREVMAVNIQNMQL